VNVTCDDISKEEMEQKRKSVSKGYSGYHQETKTETINTSKDVEKEFCHAVH
jgi:hypothetical protein